MDKNHKQAKETRKKNAEARIAQAMKRKSETMAQINASDRSGTIPIQPPVSGCARWSC
mgnify:FL=1